MVEQGQAQHVVHTEHEGECSQQCTTKRGAEMCSIMSG